MHQGHHGLDLYPFTAFEGRHRQARRCQQGTRVYAAALKVSDRQVNSQAYGCGHCRCSPKNGSAMDRSPKMPTGRLHYGSCGGSAQTFVTAPRAGVPSSSVLAVGNNQNPIGQLRLGLPPAPRTTAGPRTHDTDGDGSARRRKPDHGQPHRMRNDLSGKTMAVVQRITGNLRHDP